MEDISGKSSANQGANISGNFSNISFVEEHETFTHSFNLSPFQVRSPMHSQSSPKHNGGSSPLFVRLRSEFSACEKNPLSPMIIKEGIEEEENGESNPAEEGEDRYDVYGRILKKNFSNYKVTFEDCLSVKNPNTISQFCDLLEEDECHVDRDKVNQKENVDPLTSMITPLKAKRALGNSTTFSSLGRSFNISRSPLQDITPPLPRRTHQIEVELRYYKKDFKNAKVFVFLAIFFLS
jgi:hypothetical protein